MRTIEQEFNDFKKELNDLVNTLYKRIKKIQNVRQNKPKDK